mgnify:CR=1 FL=1
MILKVLGWFFGISFLVSGISSLFTGDVITGLILLLATAICLPPLLNKINAATKDKVELTQGKAVIAGIVLLFIAVAFATPPPPLTPEQKAVKAEQEKTEKIKQAQQARIKKEMDDRKLATERAANKVKTINYTVIGERDFSFNGRDRFGVFVYAPEAKTKLERAAVVKQAAIDLQKRTNADFTDATLEVADFSYQQGNVLAMADYAPDGCGVSGEDCTGEKFKIEVSDAQVTALQIDVLREWEKLKGQYRGSKGYLNLEDEAKMTAVIAKKLGIAIGDTKTPYTGMLIKISEDELKGINKINAVMIKGAALEEPEKNNPSWYEPGNSGLIDERAAEWHKATYKQQVSVCADYVAHLKQIDRLNAAIADSINTKDDVKQFAVALAEGMNIGLKDSPHKTGKNPLISEAMAVAVVASGWTK